VCIVQIYIISIKVPLYVSLSCSKTLARNDLKYNNIELYVIRVVIRPYNIYIYYVTRNSTRVPQSYTCIGIRLCKYVGNSSASGVMGN
jgi:hypothetical protein